MESVGVKNADAEAALPALRDCDGSCPGLGSRAPAPAPPSCSRVNYFTICSPFPLSLPRLWNEKFGDTQRRQIGFILPELSLKASLRALRGGGFWNRIWGHRRLWWFVLFINLPGLRDAQIAACTVHMFLWWDTRDKLALQREELGLAYSWGDSSCTSRWVSQWICLIPFQGHIFRWTKVFSFYSVLLGCSALPLTKTTTLATKFPTQEYLNLYNDKRHFSPKWKHKVLRKDGWMMFRWGKHMKDCFITVDTGVES